MFLGGAGGQFCFVSSPAFTELVVLFGKAVSVLPDAAGKQHTFNDL